MKYILVSGLFLSLAYSNYERGHAPYVVLLVSILLITCGYLIEFLQRHSIGFKMIFSIGDFSPLDRFLSSILVWLSYLIVFSWLIGVLIGISNDVNPNLVFRNFFGLVIYMLFPFMLIVLPSQRSLIIMIFLSGMFQIYYGFDKSYWLIMNPSAFQIHLSISELRSIYNTGFITIFPLFTVSLASQLLPKRYHSNNYGKMVNVLSNSLIFVLMTLIGLVVPAMSKGFILSTVILFLSVVFFSIKYSIEEGKMRKKLIILFILICALLYILPSSFYETIIYSFSSQERSNLVRAEQFGYLASELTFWGNGLGSALSSGYTRDSTGYGFELTYVNILHKLGVFSIFLFLSYIITLTVAFIRIVRKVYVFESFFVIGLMGYLIVGAANPLLLSPIAVILHCVAMYILVKPFLRPLKENHVVKAP